MCLVQACFSQYGQGDILKKLMDTIQSSKAVFKVKLSAYITDLKQEVTNVQQAALQEIPRKVSKSTSFFGRKAMKSSTNSTQPSKTP